MSASRGLRTEWVRCDSAVVERLRCAWLELAGRALEPNPFFEPALVEPALAHLPSLAGLTLLSAWRGSDLIAVLPCVPRPLRRFPHVKLGHTTALHPHCFLGTPLIDAEDAAAAVDGLLDGLDRYPLSGLAWIDGFDADGPFARLLAERSEVRQQPSLVLARDERALLTADAGGVERYLETTLDRRERRDLDRRRRGLTAMGSLESRPLDGDPAAFVEAFLQIEASGWKGEAGTAMACTAADTAFLRAMAAALHAQGRLRGHGLLLEGAWIAVSLDIVAGDGCFAFKTTYDERYRRFAPGKLLEIETIRTAHAPGAPRWFDSCTAPDNAMLGRLWRDRRTIERRIVAGRNPASRAVLRLLARSPRHAPHGAPPPADTAIGLQTGPPDSYAEPSP